MRGQKLICQDDERLDTLVNHISALGINQFSEGRLTMTIPIVSDLVMGIPAGLVAMLAITSPNTATTNAS